MHNHPNHPNHPIHRSTRNFGIAIAMAALLTLGSAAACRRDSPRKEPPKGRTTAPTRELILVTYNVLASPRRANARIPALLRILKATEADIIALQEVTPWFLRILLTQPWIQRYHVTPTGPGGVAPGGLMILSVFPITRTLVASLPGRQGRKGLLADLQVDGKTLAVLTCHLESTLTDGKTRATQLENLFPLLQHAPDAVLLGDLNFGDKAQPETKKLPKAYRDLWTALRKDAPGYTWDNERSAMAKKGAYTGEQSRRLDRILWRSAKWRPHTVRIIGTRPVAPHKPNLFPSDHFGLMGILQR